MLNLELQFDNKLKKLNNDYDNLNKEIQDNINNALDLEINNLNKLLITKIDKKLDIIK